ncbi:MAG: peptide chain release factor N(5)-glutamine methyltransferase [gamma proteobacterium symbiont of Taylorina sp.]|nr:peptide chain release factor N(5)-glutamine methyltransferase [gamma proteobacterium symbiont of Taylorina sp.]
MFDKSPEQILGKSWLLTWPDNSLSLKQFQQYSDYLNLRSKGMPVAYITGEKDFWTFTLSVTPDTLIPRPETELLVDYALEKISMTESTRLLELGTGSGAIALAIASERKNCRIVATDISYAALNIAKKNALSLKLSQVSFQQSSWFDSINEGMEFDMIISNPPYIAQDDPQLEHNVKKYEPLAALFAADNGLDDIKQIIKNAPDYLKESGWILLEHGYNQAEAVQSLLNNHAFTRIASIKDLNRQERITMAQLNEYKK